MAAATLPSSTFLVAGPTAVGKSEVALALAERVGGELVSVDSMQVYRGLDIGTAKPSATERARVPHHLLDLVEVTEGFDAARFVTQAHEAITAIAQRGRVPILCGGTGLYFKALLEGLSEAPPVDPALRDQLRAMPLAELLRELAESDPAAYAHIDRQNPRRVIRAVEVVRLTGKPFSQQRVSWSAPGAGAPLSARAFGLARAPGDLRRRIERRVDEMFRRGLVAETEALLQRGLAQNPIALQALGYHQVVEHLRGERSLPDTVALVKIRTWQFAKRQMTWFRRQTRLNWIHLEPEAPLEPVLEKLAAAG